ncbi:zinc ABC transporter ATP-binding protein AztA [Glycomyces buryatensis]|uniref:ATP-binding cassette domain-containing protein n=1 Tax=Glycomyces buryatensis TaxID=2570927 RepID=A0A4V6T6Q6_9ACTN|nr:zinc ABC transporter ATP-binding protein AztA [Glycomyces buryatensis]THV41506.1 ATP-binding cassette domain-containing protein [Glycomyces buryatensis]
MSNSIELTQVSARHGATTVLHGVTVSIPAHQVTAVTGHNGSGKSTLLGVLSGAHPPASGSLRRSHSGRAALVVQRSEVPDALPITVRQAVAMGRWAHRGAWRRLTREDRLIAELCMDRLGVTGLADRRLSTLSGGQRQRVLLAQGLAQQSDLLVLDEPCTGLDAEAKEQIAALLAEESARGVTVVHATHDPEDAAKADHHITLSNGRLLIDITELRVRWSWREMRSPTAATGRGCRFANACQVPRRAGGPGVKCAARAAAHCR